MGDYVDRGPDSRATLDILINRSRRGNTVFLKGNHEVFLGNVLRDPSLLTEWLHVGGLYTLMSYGLTPSPTPRGMRNGAHWCGSWRARRRAGTLSFSANCTCGDFFFVHAGVRPGVPLAEQQEDDLLWIREEFLQSQQNFWKFVVHGHTPVRHPELLKNRANIDTGAYATGNLTLMTIQGTSMLAV
jgi:serine/threonine protein phosphatase 1